MKTARDFTGYGKISDSFQSVRQVAVDTLEKQNKAYIEAGLATGASTIEEARERGRSMEKSFLDMQSCTTMLSICSICQTNYQPAEEKICGFFSD